MNDPLHTSALLNLDLCAAEPKFYCTVASHPYADQDLPLRHHNAFLLYLADSTWAKWSTVIIATLD